MAEASQSKMTDFITSTPSNKSEQNGDDDKAKKPHKKRTKVDRSGLKDEFSESDDSEFELFDDANGDYDKESDEEMSNKDLKKFITKMFMKFDDRWMKVQKRVSKIEKKYVSLQEKHVVLEDKTKLLEEEINQLKLDNNHNNQYSRKNNINIHGIPESSSAESVDQCADTVVQTLNDKQIPITRDMIEIAHRVPGQPRAGTTRKIIVRLKLRGHKDVVMKNKKQLKGSDIRIYEDASPLNGKLLYDLRKHADVESSWMNNGKVLAKLKSGRIRPFSILDQVGEGSNLA